MKVLCKFSCRYQVTVGSCACTVVVAKGSLIEGISFWSFLTNGGLTLETSGLESLYGGQDTLPTQFITPNYLIHGRSTTASLETYPLYSYRIGPLFNILLFVRICENVVHKTEQTHLMLAAIWNGCCKQNGPFIKTRV